MNSSSEQNNKKTCMSKMMNIAAMVLLAVAVCWVVRSMMQPNQTRRSLTEMGSVLFDPKLVAQLGGNPVKYADLNILSTVSQ